MRMRVPRRFLAVAPTKTEIHRSLGTDSLRRAQELLPAVKAAIIDELEARLDLNREAMGTDAYRSAVRVASARGFTHQSISQIASGSFDALLQRVEAIKPNDDSMTVKAILGGVEQPTLMVSGLVAEVERISKHENRFKSENQMRLWRNPRLRAVANLQAALGGDIPVTDIRSEEALKHRSWWLERIAQTSVSADTANKDFANMSGMLRRYYDHQNMAQPPKPYAGIQVSDRHKKKMRKLQIPTDWIKEVWFAEGAFDGINTQARDILLMSIETGCRQSEIHDLPADAIVLNAPIPHLRIDNSEGEHRREIKNAPSSRCVPLVGVALAAAKRNPCGFPRYRGASSYSATVNKYLRTRGLLPSPKHTIGGTRHSWEARLKAALIDSDDRGEMMGHDVSSIRNRELYGDEMPLERKLELAQRVVLDVPEHLA
jgi:hypothetical protein